MDMVALSALLTAIIWHQLLSRFWLAVFGSAVTAVLMFWAMAFSMGHFAWEQSFWVETIVVPLSVASGVSVFVGSVFRLLTKRHK